AHVHAAYGDAECDAHAGLAYSDAAGANGHGDAHAIANGHGDAYPHRCCSPHGDGNTDGHLDGDGNAYADCFAHAHAGRSAAVLAAASGQELPVPGWRDANAVL
ncbi:MAG: hypothetical protein ACPL7R_00760, partial [Anaerolineae bacterium]